ncbi:MAG: hypothetical protein WKF92_10015 [Pyrinomonadaceae bacterium]
MRSNYLIVAFLVLACLGFAGVVFPEVAGSILVVSLLSAIAIFLFRKFTEDKRFVTNVFLAALFARLIFGLFVHYYDLRDFFGGDANTFDFNGFMLAKDWTGNPSWEESSWRRVSAIEGPGWGMNYLVGGLYYLIGRNILAAQSFCAVIGAATAPMVYYCSVKIFQSKNVGRISAIGIAFFPSFIIWSGQLMKDGLIIFLLVLAITMVLQLQEKFNYAALVLLILPLGGIIALRFYIFYMLAIAVAGSFIIGVSKSTQSILTRTAILMIMGLSLTYLGVIRNAGTNFETYGNLERIERSRSDLSASADSGFGADADVSTAAGAISAIPLGLVYLMLAPFPWQMTSFRQAITLPEVLIWWAMIPLMVVGIWYSARNRLRSAFPILIFSLTLTLAYSLFQGNVGTAYRQRTQIQVFLFIFIAVGWTLFKERRDDKKIIRMEKRKQFERRLKARSLAG